MKKPEELYTLLSPSLILLRLSANTHQSFLSFFFLYVCYILLASVHCSLYAELQIYLYQKDEINVLASKNYSLRKPVTFV
jgi:hypothetical protein